ncbi:MAG: SCP2 sterol-binding domain-containing protein [Halobacteria archaeon]
MAVEFPSDEWIEAWKDKLNDNEEYREKAQDWGLDFNGDFLFTIEPDNEALKEEFEDRVSDKGDIHYYVGLEAGECTEVYPVQNPSDEEYGFEIVGPFSNWEALTRGEIGAIDGLMSGKFELNGNMQQVMQYSDAAVNMVETASDIETEYKY